MPLRVMTWNLWWRFGAWEAREAAIVEVLREQAPDVVCLQEVWVRRDRHGRVEHQLDRLSAALGWSWVANEPVWFDGTAFTNAVLSRWPLEPTLDAPLPRHDGSPGHRRVVAAAVSTPWGAWPVMSTHLDHRFDASAVRQLQATQLLQHVVDLRGDPDEDLPVVLGGDLNAVPDSDEVRLLTGRRAGGPAGVVMSDVWEQVGEAPGTTWSRRNPEVAASAWPDRRIDYVMVAWPRPKPVGNPVRAWLAGDEAVGGVWPSDHAAVIVELVVPGTT